MDNKKIYRLKKIIKDSGSMIIAFSGGVDSSFLLQTAVKILGKNVIAVTARSPVYVKSELKDAKRFTKELNCRHIILYHNQLKIKGFANNPLNRCYICKKDLLLKLISIKNKYQFNIVADGTNYNDLNKYRPGLKSLKELGVQSPLAESFLTKKEIRECSRLLNLPTWDKPAMACLASRFPYGEKITKAKLKKVVRAEDYLYSLGFKQRRVRYFYPTAKIEIEKDEIPRLMQDYLRDKIIKKFKEIGFLYISVDLEGYRPGEIANKIIDLKS
jgi:uncharacterized protein